MSTDNPHVVASISTLFFDKDGCGPDEVELEVVVPPLMPENCLGLRIRQSKARGVLRFGLAPVDAGFVLDRESAERLHGAIAGWIGLPVVESAKIQADDLRAIIVEYVEAGRNAAKARCRYIVAIESGMVDASLEPIIESDKREIAARAALLAVVEGPAREVDRG